MMCLGYNPVTAGWYAQTNPLNYVAPPYAHLHCKEKYNCT